MKIFSYILLLNRRALKTGSPTSLLWETTFTAWLLSYSFESSETLLWNPIWPLFHWARGLLMQFHQHLLRPYCVLIPVVGTLPKDTKAEMLSYKLRCVHSCAPFCHFSQVSFWQKPEYGEKILTKVWWRPLCWALKENAQMLPQLRNFHQNDAHANTGNTIFKYTLINESIFCFSWWLFQLEGMLESL